MSLTAIDTYAPIFVLIPLRHCAKSMLVSSGCFSGNRCTRSCSSRVSYMPQINFSEKEIASIERHEMKTTSKLIIPVASAKTICLYYSLQRIMSHPRKSKAQK
ncbi:hypothetical protein P5V15_009001 [Pogonomyrmex californicus]